MTCGAGDHHGQGAKLEPVHGNGPDPARDGSAVQRASQQPWDAQPVPGAPNPLPARAAPPRAREARGAEQVDPNAVGNGPPVTGTFYPGNGLGCVWVCPINLDQNLNTTGPNITTPGADIVITSPVVPATWRGYTRITCVSPRMPVPSAPNQPIIDTACQIKARLGRGRSPWGRVLRKTLGKPGR